MILNELLTLLLIAIVHICNTLIHIYFTSTKLRLKTIYLLFVCIIIYHFTEKKIINKFTIPVHVSVVGIVIFLHFKWLIIHTAIQAPSFLRLEMELLEG